MDCRVGSGVGCGFLKAGGVAVLSGFEAADLGVVRAAMEKAGGRVVGEFGELEWRDGGGENFTDYSASNFSTRSDTLRYFAQRCR